MKRRICALFCALLMLASFSSCVFATIQVVDPDGSVHYDTDETAPETQAGAFSAAAKKALEGLSGFWRRFGAVTVVTLLLIAIVVAIVISEFERQKKEGHPPQAKSKRKKK